jgi:hypothetical protein
MPKHVFIKTKDEETKNILLSLGYKMQSKDGDIYTFLNDKTLSFDDKKLKVTYSDVLTF